MNVRIFFNCGLAVAICLAFSTSLSAQFLTEDFDYADGDLTTVSGGSWVNHSGDPPDIQVLGGSAVVTAPGGADNNRQIGMTQGDNDTWYYAVRFIVTQSDMSAVNNDYFIHFRPEGFNFRARLATAAPAAAGDFGLQIWATSGGEGMTDWDGDFSFGDEITAVVCWDNAVGTATLWVNPADMSSTNVSHTSEIAMMEPITSIALRQDSTPGSVVTIPVLSVGDDFAEVLAAVSDTGKGCPSGFDRGDVNQDGAITLLDVGPFVDAISMGSTQCEADVNGDGSVNLLDVAPFIALLSG